MRDKNRINPKSGWYKQPLELGFDFATRLFWFFSFRGFLWFRSFHAASLLWTLYQLLHDLCQQRFLILLFVGHFLPRTFAHGDGLSVVKAQCLNLSGRMRTSPQFHSKGWLSRSVDMYLNVWQNLNLHFFGLQLHPLPRTSFELVGLFSSKTHLKSSPIDPSTSTKIGASALECACTSYAVPPHLCLRVHWQTQVSRVLNQRPRTPGWLTCCQCRGSAAVPGAGTILRDLWIGCLQCLPPVLARPGQVTGVSDRTDLTCVPNNTRDLPQVEQRPSRQATKPD